MTPTQVAGHCPACGATDLWIHEPWTPQIRCLSSRCPNPGLLAAFLAVPSHRHVVDLGPDRFHTEHPLGCRLTGLADCAIDHEIATSDLARRVTPGRYFAELDGHHLSLTPVTTDREELGS